MVFGFESSGLRRNFNQPGPARSRLDLLRSPNVPVRLPGRGRRPLTCGLRARGADAAGRVWVRRRATWHALLPPGTVYGYAEARDGASSKWANILQLSC
jgi:hypothetical protein